MSRQWQLMYKIPPSFAVVGNSILFGVSWRHHVFLGTFLYAKSSNNFYSLHSNGPPLNQPWIKGSDNCLGSLKNIRLGTLKKSLNATNPPTTTLVSVVAAPTHLSCISHHPTHPLPTKSLRCQVSTAPRAIAPPLNTRACMTCAHAKFQQNSSCFFGTFLDVKSSKKYIFCIQMAPPE